MKTFFVTKLQKTFGLSLILFFVINPNPPKSQNFCPPLFLEGLPLNNSVLLFWDEPDSLAGFGDEIFNACFPVCEIPNQNIFIENIGQDTSGGWFKKSNGEFSCGDEMYPCSDTDTDDFSAFAGWSDTLSPINSRLRTSLIDLSSFVSATLFFDEYIEYSEDSNDSNWVEISTDSINWSPIYYSNPMDLGDGYVANFVDLSEYAGESIYIGFRFFDRFGNNENWYIDNIRVFGGNGNPFQNPCENLTGYNIYQDGAYIGSSQSNNYTVEGLTNNVNYCFSVSATYGQNESSLAAEACYYPIPKYELTETLFRDTLDYTLNEYSIFDFSLINNDTSNYRFTFSSDQFIEPISENIIITDDFNSLEISTFSDLSDIWTIGSSESANSDYMAFPPESGNTFFYINDDNSDNYYENITTDALLQSQLLTKDEPEPIFFMIDIYFPNPGGPCSVGNWYSEDAAIVVSQDNGLTWKKVDTTFATSLAAYDDYYSYYVPDFDFDLANWHTFVFNLSPFLEIGDFRAGVQYNDCGGSWGYGIAVDNAFILKGDSTNWFSFERISGEIIAGDILDLSVTLMPIFNQNQYSTVNLTFGGIDSQQGIDVIAITDQDNVRIVKEDLPSRFTLHQNYPNPFNPNTVIEFELNKGSIVDITVFDLLGNSIKKIVNSYYNTGTSSVSWNGTNEEGHQVGSGLYFYILTVDKNQQVKKMLFLR